jgi:hypothetical protein
MEKSNHDGNNTLSMPKSGSNNGRAFTVLRDVSLHSSILSIKINPKIDVIAVATKDGALSLHRIDWQRLWRTVSPGNECTCLTWREDGKILAVGRRNGDVELFHVENGNNHAGGEGAVYPSWTVERMTERFCDGLGEEEDGKRKISALCWTGVVGSIAEDKETDTQLTKEFEALARSGSHATSSSGSNNTAALLFNDDSSASKFHARPKLSVSNAALAMMRGGKSSGQSGKSFGFVRRNKGVDVEETIEDDVLLEEDEDEEDEDEERWEIDEDQQAWNRDQILDHKAPPSQMNVLVAGDVSGNVACFGFGAFPLFWQKVPTNNEDEEKSAVEAVSVSKEKNAICARVNGNAYAMLSFDLLSQHRVKATYDFALHAAHTSQLLSACLSSVAMLSKRWKAALKTAFYHTVVDFAISSIDPDFQRFIVTEKPKRVGKLSAGASYLRGDDDDDENEKKTSMSEIIADEKFRAQFCDIFCKDALSLYETGIIDRGLEDFFGVRCKSGELKKRARRLDHETNVAHDVLVKKVAPALSVAFSRLRELRGLSRWKKHAKPLGLREETLDKLCEEVELACLACHDATTACTMVGSRNRAIFAFLMRAQKRMETGVPLAAVPNLPEANVENVMDALGRSSELSTDRLEMQLSRHGDDDGIRYGGLRDCLETLLKTWDEDFLRETSGTIEGNVVATPATPGSNSSIDGDVDDQTKKCDTLSANATFISSGSLAVQESFRDAVRNGCQFGKDVVASNFGMSSDDMGTDTNELYYETVEPLDALEYTNGRALTLLVPKEEDEAEEDMAEGENPNRHKAAVLVLADGVATFDDDGEDDDERKCRRLPPNAVGPIECSTSRGLAAVRIGANRFIVLDLEEDEEDDDENDVDE